MKITVFAFGKVKTPGLRLAIDYYLKLTSTWVKIKEHELKPIKILNKNQKIVIQKQEEEILTQVISKHISARKKIFLLDELGIPKTTLKWSETFKAAQDQGIEDVVFCIGSSLGFSAQLKKNTDGLISFGPQTLPHELARVVLCEQIFRGLSVLKNHPYHNEGE